MLPMTSKIPPISDIKSRLESLTNADIRELARLSAVPFTTLLKIRSGETVNPGIETVRSFDGYLKKIQKLSAERAEYGRIRV